MKTRQSLSSKTVALEKLQVPERKRRKRPKKLLRRCSSAFTRSRSASVTVFGSLNRVKSRASMARRSSPWSSSRILRYSSSVRSGFREVTQYRAICLAIRRKWVDSARTLVLLGTRSRGEHTASARDSNQMFLYKSVVTRRDLYFCYSAVVTVVTLREVDG